MRYSDVYYKLNIKRKIFYLGRFEPSTFDLQVAHYTTTLLSSTSNTIRYTYSITYKETEIRLWQLHSRLHKWLVLDSFISKIIRQGYNWAFVSFGTRTTSLFTGLRRQPFCVFSWTALTKPWSSDSVSVTSPNGQRLRGALSLTITTLPTCMLRRVAVHFGLVWWSTMFSFFQRVQNKFARYCTRLHWRLIYRSTCWKTPGGGTLWPMIAKSGYDSESVAQDLQNLRTQMWLGDCSGLPLLHTTKCEICLSWGNIHVPPVVLQASFRSTG